jgi:hypothetical protein
MTREAYTRPSGHSVVDSSPNIQTARREVGGRIGESQCQSLRNIHWLDALGPKSRGRCLVPNSHGLLFRVLCRSRKSENVVSGDVELWVLTYLTSIAASSGLRGLG